MVTLIDNTRPRHPEKANRPDTPVLRKPDWIRVKAPTGAALSVPAGFEVSVYADGDFKSPRYLIEGPNGDVFVSDSYGDTVYLLRDANKDGKIDNAAERFRALVRANFGDAHAARANSHRPGRCHRAPEPRVVALAA